MINLQQQDTIEPLVIGFMMVINDNLTPYNDMPYCFHSHISELLMIKSINSLINILDRDKK